MGAVFYHQLDALVVHEEAVLDGIDAADDGVLDPLGALSVRCGLDVGVLGLLDEGADLLHAVLALGGSVLLGHDAAGGHDLEEVGALAELLTSRFPDLVDAVGDPPEQKALGPFGRHKVDVAVTPAVCETASPRRDDPGPDHRALLDRAFDEDPVHPADLPDRGEARVDDAPGVVNGSGSAHVRLLGDRRRQVRRQQAGEMDVGVDQPRHHRLARDVDDLGPLRDHDLERSTGRGDCVVLDKNQRVGDRVAAVSVDQCPTFEYGHIVPHVVLLLLLDWCSQRLHQGRCVILIFQVFDGVDQARSDAGPDPVRVGLEFGHELVPSHRVAG